MTSVLSILSHINKLEIQKIFFFFLFINFFDVEYFGNMQILYHFYQDFIIVVNINDTSSFLLPLI